MKKVVLLAGLALVVSSLTGCSTCRRLTGGWFTRGDRCGAPPPALCAPGVPMGTTMMVPTSPQVLPGPMEVTPLN